MELLTKGNEDIGQAYRILINYCLFFKCNYFQRYSLEAGMDIEFSFDRNDVPICCRLQFIAK